MADYTQTKAIGQFDKNSCWAACLSWWLKAVGDGRPALSQLNLIAEFDKYCDPDTGGLSPKAFKDVVSKDARFKMSMSYFTASKFVGAGLPIGDTPIIVIYNYPTIGGTHMNVVFEKRDGTVNCMEPYFPYPGKDGNRTGKFERRPTSHFLNSPEIGLAWATVKFD